MDADRYTAGDYSTRVAPDLQGSRYLYLPIIGWAGLLACMASASGTSRVARLTSVMTVTLILATYLVGLEIHLRPWHAAAALRDRVEQAAVQHFPACPDIRLSNLPDNVDGAYVLRNGAPEAFARLGIRVTNQSPGKCSFAWDDERRGFSERPE
jgi:hypothetical protein